MQITRDKNVEIPDFLKKTDTKVYYSDTGCKILVSKESSKWHLSISHEDRQPTYEELKEARYKLCPDNIYMAQIFPPKSQFINIHKNCFHLYQIEGDKKYNNI